MTLATLYLGDRKNEGFFNVPQKKKTNSFIKGEREKPLADKIIDKVLLDLEKESKQEKKK